MSKRTKKKAGQYLLKVRPPLNEEDSDEYEYLIVISAWEENGVEMVDQHFVEEIFPELADLGICDLGEGQMVSSGEAETFDLVDALRKFGFKVEIVI